MSAARYGRIARLIFSANLPDLIAQAEGGDLHAGREALRILAGSLANNQPGEMSDMARNYLSRALLRAASGQCDAGVALHLKRAGRPNRSKRQKLFGAFMVLQFIDGGSSVLDAAACAAEVLSTPPFGEERHPEAETYQPETVQSWYYEMKGELEALCRHVDEGTDS